MTWMIYGANGYTGRLIAQAAVAGGMRPILAGRSEASLRPIAQELGLELRVFGLETPEEVDRGLAGLRLVLHCAGPYSQTSAPMAEACLRQRVHYLDITGEIAVFEALAARNEAALAAGVMLLPGVGFDVVPTDCLAAMLAEALPGSNSLTLAFWMVGGSSPGTAKTMVEGLGGGAGAARVDGKIQQVPPAWVQREVPFSSRPRHAVSIPWGDVSTAFYSTGIPNITTLMALPPSTARWMKLGPLLAPVLGLGAVQRGLKALVTRTVKGPDSATRAAGRCELWGEVVHPDGRRLQGGFICSEGYTFTVSASIAAVQRTLRNPHPGFQTPSRAFGAHFVEEVGATALKIG